MSNSSSSKHQKIILVTGATAGIGRMTALHLAKLGHHVIASGRKLPELAALRTEAGSLKLDTVALDVTSTDSIAAAVKAIEELTHGRGLDALVNNAGFGILGPTSEIGDAEMRRQYETNVFGLMNVTRAFLPKMISRGSGRVINVSSVGGRITLPYFGVYNSTKYALEALSDALRYEMRPFGVDVSLIEPGIIRTNFEATAVSGLSQFSSTQFAPAVAKYEAMSKFANKFASDPIVIAKAIAKAVSSRRPRARYVAPFSNHMIFMMSSMLPTRMWDWAMRKVGFLTKKGLRLNSAQRPAQIEAAN
jgi:NAD(P)-dependent dehydrogenase (short-subunit alcohol dehydrogenase family)